MSRQRILVVDDEPDIGMLVKDTLEDEGFEVDLAQNARDARAQFTTQIPDLVLLDIWMPDEDGISLLKSWQEGSENCPPIVIMSGHGTVETAVEATRLGARSFIEKPLTTAKLLQSVHAALAGHTAFDTLTRITRGPVGNSLNARQLREQVTQLTKNDVHVSIVGESGTGKATLAEYIHYHSHRTDAPFTVAFATALDEKLLQTALADTVGGTLLIKQAHELMPTQRKKIAAILTSEYLASQRIRLIITSRNEVTELSQKTGLVQTVLEIAPLREHTEDIPELTGACTDYLCQTQRLPYRRFSIAAQNHLLHYHWPGNLYELNELVRELLESGNTDEVSLQEIEKLLSNRQGKSIWLEQALNQPLREAREMFERFYLKHQLENVDGNVTRLAAKVGMERTHLYRKLRTLGIQLQDGSKPS